MTHRIDDTTTKQAASAIKLTLSKYRLYVAYAAMADAEVAIVARSMRVDDTARRILEIVNGMQTGAALEAIRLTRNALTFENRLSALFNGQIYPAALTVGAV